MSKQLSKKQKYINDEKARSNNKVIYVLNKKGKPLMVTKRHKHVRDLLKEGKAVAVNNNPFTIRLKYDTPNIVQELTLSIDPGRESIGLSVINPKDNSLIFSANVETNNKRIKTNMSERKTHRASRRRHKRIKKQRKVMKDNNSFVESKNTKKDILRTKKECFSKDISYPGMEEYIAHKVCKGKEAKFNNRVRKNIL